ncbi:MAG: hydrogenase maturation protease [Candidatus Omnitrophota bacterium]
MTLIIGCGNILLGDEGVGVHLIETLSKQEVPAGVDLLDGGTGGIELITYIEKADKVIIVDAIQAGGESGAIYKFRPDDYEQEDCPISSASLHEICLKDVFSTMKQLGIKKDILIFGIEPESVELKIGLSEKISKLLPKLIDLVLNEIKG